MAASDKGRTRGSALFISLIDVCYARLNSSLTLHT